MHGMAAQPERLWLCGTVNVDFAVGGTNVALVLPVGIAKIAITKVYAGATATGLVALY